jgi:hypothetical protein
VTVVARSKQFDAARCAAAARDFGVRGLHRPDARLQPIEQREIVGVSAEERLAR